jgi:hypothetical protein
MNGMKNPVHLSDIRNGLSQLTVDSGDKGCSA